MYSLGLLVLRESALRIVRGGAPNGVAESDVVEATARASPVRYAIYTPCVSYGEGCLTSLE